MTCKHTGIYIYTVQCIYTCFDSFTVDHQNNYVSFRFYEEINSFVESEKNMGEVSRDYAY